MSMQHTPTPWEVDEEGRIVATDPKDAERFIWIAEMVGNTRNRGIAADRDHIVLCVNSHDALVEALRKIADPKGDYIDDNDALHALQDIARAALKAATE